MEINFNDYAIKLAAGAHSTPQEGMCIMECVAYIEGEKHTDHPKCACPVITAFALKTNDWMTTEERQDLLPFVLRIAGSKSTLEAVRKRAFMATDYAVRIFAPMALRAENLEAQALSLESCAQIVDKETAKVGEKAAIVYAHAAASHAASTAACAHSAASTVFTAAHAAHSAAHAPITAASHAASTAAAAASHASTAAAAASHAAFITAASIAASSAASHAASARKVLVQYSLQLLDEMLKVSEVSEVFKGASESTLTRLRELETITGV